MKKFIVFLIVSIFFAVSCGNSKKTENDADASENRDEDAVETEDSEEEETDETTDDEAESANDNDFTIADDDYSYASGLPKCSLQGKAPCYDPATDLVWSSLSAPVKYEDAIIYCYTLEEGGFKDWYLPDIDELRTLVRKCPELEPKGACRVSEKTNCLSSEDCHSSKNCTEACSDKKDEIFSKLWDTRPLWSKSEETSQYEDYFWAINFNIPSISYENKNAELSVRCARNVHSSGEAEEVQSQRAECTELPENAKWNSVSSITQSWNGVYWAPDAKGTFSEESSTENCYFKCFDDYFWIDHQAYGNKSGICMGSCGKTKDSLCGYPGTDRFYDKDSALFWSSIANESVYFQDPVITIWQNAVNYCERLEEDGHDDWRLPSIEELRTLLKNCPATEPGGTCITEGIGSYDHTDDSCRSCEHDYTYSGKYSRLGDFWGSLWASDVAYEYYGEKVVWEIDFVSGWISLNMESYGKNFGYRVRCVRKKNEE